MGVTYHYFYKASLHFDPVPVFGILQTYDKSNVFNIENVKDLISARHPAGGRCRMVHCLSYLGESEDDHGV